MAVRNRGDRVVLLLLLLLQPMAEGATVLGERKKWHRVTVVFDGPFASETGNPNPFLDYRLTCRFSHAGRGSPYVVPGFFLADVDAANSGKTSGDKWACRFAPDATGTWTWTATFRAGKDVAVADTDSAGAPGGYMDGETGKFDVGPTDKTGRDHRGKGRLAYVGKHHLQFLETGEYFLKSGTDSPEAILCYKGFDGTHGNDGVHDGLFNGKYPYLFDWAAHARDYRSGDPDWNGENGNGRNLIGALNYLAREKGMNAFSFLPLSARGDNQNSFPYVRINERDRFDVSKLEQWEIVFSHADTLGLYLHFKLGESENFGLHDGGAVLGRELRVYYREIIARFSHHLALNWNVAEEAHHNGIREDRWIPRVQHIADLCPYQHLRVIHFGDGGNHFYDRLLGGRSALTGTSFQTRYSNSYALTSEYVAKSAKEGKPWVVAHDEQEHWQVGCPPDGDYGQEQNPRTFRQQTTWGNVMAGGAGLEIYFGFNEDKCGDRTCQDLRTRDRTWDWCRYRNNFFTDNAIPFWDMAPRQDLLDTPSESGRWCLAKPGEVYVVFLVNPEVPARLNLGTGGTFSVRWFNPVDGTAGLQTGSVVELRGVGGWQTLGTPPSGGGAEEWVALVSLETAGSPPPQVSITTPADGTRVNWPTATVAVRAAVTVADGRRVEVVEYVVGGQVVGTAKGAGPYEHVVRVGAPGRYEITVRATDDEGKTGTGRVTVVFVPPPDTEPPTAPGNVRGRAVSHTEASIEWDAASDNVGVVGYEVLSGGKVVAEAAGSPATVQGLAGGTSYSFLVRARDAAGNLSPTGGPVAVVTPMPPPEVVVVDLALAGAAGTSGWTYRDDTFRATTRPSYASGSHVPGEGLRVVVGGVDNTHVTNGMSGGWERGLSLPGRGVVRVAVTFSFSMITEYEDDEYSEVLVALDGKLLKQGGADYALRVAGGGEYTGTVTVVADGAVGAGNHVLTVGVHNNKKTYHDESTTVTVSRVVVTQLGVAVDDQPPTPPRDLSLVRLTPHLIEVLWSPSSDNVAVAGYTVHIVDTSSSPARSVDVGNVVSHSFTATPDTRYEVSVTASDAQGNVSPRSATLMLRTPPLPSTPSPSPPPSPSTPSPSPTLMVFDDDLRTGLRSWAYRDDTFRATTRPSYASGNHVPGEGLRVVVGGVDNVYIKGMSGGWERGLTLPGRGVVRVAVTFSFSMITEYEDDEYSEVLVALDGKLLKQGGADYALRVAGGGEYTGTVTVVADGAVGAGNHVLTVGVHNNKKTYHDESTTVTVSRVVVTQLGVAVDDQPPTPPRDLSLVRLTPHLIEVLWSPSSDNVAVAGYTVHIVDTSARSVDVGNVVSHSFTATPDTRYEVSVTASDAQGNVSPRSATLVLHTPPLGTSQPTSPQSPPPPTSLLFDDDLRTGLQSWVFRADALRGTNQPSYASGSHVAGEGLRVTVGGVDDKDIDNMSGGWWRSFTSPGGDVVLTIDYTFDMAVNYDDNEHSELLVAVDNVVLATLFRATGGGHKSESIEVTLSNVAPGTRTVIVGVFNNRKTFNNEFTVLHIHRVSARSP